MIVVEASGMMAEMGAGIPSYSYTMGAEGGVETEVELERLQPPQGGSEEAEVFTEVPEQKWGRWKREGSTESIYP